MEGNGASEGGGQPRKRRPCSRPGCIMTVKKPTAKYCSVQCCALDPERHERLRLQARRSRRTVLPMARQLSWDHFDSPDPEALIARTCEGREDVPVGMSRFAI